MDLYTCLLKFTYKIQIMFVVNLKVDRYGNHGFGVLWDKNCISLKIIIKFENATTLQ